MQRQAADSTSLSPLLNACAQGDVAEVAKLLAVKNEQGDRIHTLAARDPDGRNAFMLAISQDHAAIVSLLRDVVSDNSEEILKPTDNEGNHIAAYLLEFKACACFNEFSNLDFQSLIRLDEMCVTTILQNYAKDNSLAQYFYSTEHAGFDAVLDVDKWMRVAIADVEQDHKKIDVLAVLLELLKDDKVQRKLPSHGKFYFKDLPQNLPTDLRAKCNNILREIDLCTRREIVNALAAGEYNNVDNLIARLRTGFTDEVNQPMQDMQHILERIENAPMQSIRANQIFISMVENCDIEGVNAWLMAKRPITTVDSQGRNAVFIAVSKDDADMLDILLQEDEKTLESLVFAQDKQKRDLCYYFLKYQAIKCYQRLNQNNKRSHKDIRKNIAAMMKSSVFDYLSKEPEFRKLYYRVEDGGFGHVLTATYLSGVIDDADDNLTCLSTLMALLEDKKVCREIFYDSGCENICPASLSKKLKAQYKAKIKALYKKNLNAEDNTLFVAADYLPHVDSPTLADLKKSGIYQISSGMKDSYPILMIQQNAKERVLRIEQSRMLHNMEHDDDVMLHYKNATSLIKYLSGAEQPAEDLSMDLTQFRKSHLDAYKQYQAPCIYEVTIGHALITGHILLFELLVTQFNVEFNPKLLLMLPIKKIAATMQMLSRWQQANKLPQGSSRNIISGINILVILGKLDAAKAYAKRRLDMMAKVSLKLALGYAISKERQKEILAIQNLIATNYFEICSDLKSEAKLCRIILHCQSEAVLTALVFLLKMDLSQENVGKNLLLYACETGNTGMLKFIKRMTDYRQSLQISQQTHFANGLKTFDPLLPNNRSAIDVALKHGHAHLVPLLNEMGILPSTHIENDRPNKTKKKKHKKKSCTLTLNTNVMAMASQSATVSTPANPPVDKHALLTERLAMLTKLIPTLKYEVTDPYNNKLILKDIQRNNKIMQEIKLNFLNIKKLKKGLPEHTITQEKIVIDGKPTVYLVFTIEENDIDVPLTLLKNMIVAYQYKDTDVTLLPTSANTKGCVITEPSARGNWEKVILSAFGFVEGIHLSWDKNAYQNDIVNLTLPKMNRVWCVRSPEMRHDDLHPVYINAASVMLMLNKLRTHLTTDNRGIVTQTDNLIIIQPNVESFAVTTDVYKQLQETTNIRATWETAFSKAFCVDQVNGEWQLYDGREAFVFELPSDYNQRVKLYQEMTDKFLNFCHRIQAEITFAKHTIIVMPSDDLKAIEYPPADHKKLMALLAEQQAVPESKQAPMEQAKAVVDPMPGLANPFSKHDIELLFSWIVKDILPHDNFNGSFGMKVDSNLTKKEATRRAKRFLDLCIGNKVLFQHQSKQYQTKYLLELIVECLNDQFEEDDGNQALRLVYNKNNIITGLSIDIKALTSHTLNKIGNEAKAAFNFAIKIDEKRATEVIELHHLLQEAYQTSEQSAEETQALQQVIADFGIDIVAFDQRYHATAKQAVTEPLLPAPSVILEYSPIFKRLKMSPVHLSNLRYHLTALVWYDTKGARSTDAEIASFALYVMHAVMAFDLLAIIVNVNHGRQHSLFFNCLRNIFRHAANEIDVNHQLPLIQAFIKRLLIALDHCHTISQNFLLATQPVYSLSVEKHYLVDLAFALYSFRIANNLHDLGNSTVAERRLIVNSCKRLLKQLFKAGDRHQNHEQLAAFYHMIGCEHKRFARGITKMSQELAHYYETAVEPIGFVALLAELHVRYDLQISKRLQPQPKPPSQSSSLRQKP